MDQKRNVFILSTEYHFLIVMSIIQEHFKDGEWLNVLVFTGKRLADVKTENFPENLKHESLVFKTETNVSGRVNDLIGKKGLANLFVFHAYRPLETYALCRVPKGVETHLLQDGGVFYNLRERSEFFSRLHVTFDIYKALWKKGIILRKFVLYKQFQQQSQYIDNVWVTNPDIYIEPRFLKKRIRLITIPEKETLVQKLNGYFSLNRKFDNYLIYLAPKIYTPELVNNEINEIKKIMELTGKSNLLIKLHPAARDFQVKILRDNFGDNVIQNGIPAEMYIANATNSCVVASASTALFYYNPSCTYFGLKKYYMALGLYPKWNNIILPEHVKQISSLEEMAS